VQTLPSCALASKSKQDSLALHRIEILLSSKKVLLPHPHGFVARRNLTRRQQQKWRQSENEKKHKERERDTILGRTLSTQTADESGCQPLSSRKTKNKILLPAISKKGGVCWLPWTKKSQRNPDVGVGLSITRNFFFSFFCFLFVFYVVSFVLLANSISTHLGLVTGLPSSLQRLLCLSKKNVFSHGSLVYSSHLLLSH
jgi:hypothetical protein